MTDRLPPLTALRAFDAAARHMSFSLAADELGVTPAALSFQIKSLEEHLGTLLFHRLNRKVELTEAGRTLAPGARDGFEALGAAWRATRRLQDDNSLTVTAGPGFTSKWLAPRLYEFARQHPEIELRFSASLRIVSFDQDDIDVAIRFGYGPDPGLHSVALAKEWVTPVMTPDMARIYPTPEDLKQAPLIYDHSVDFLDPPCDWPAWFRAAGITHEPKYTAFFSQTDHAIDAALAGVGVVMGRRGFVVKDLAEGRLVAPYRLALGTDAHFRFLCREGEQKRPQIAAFKTWILDEIDKLAHVSGQMDIIPAGQISIADNSP
ncbi:transcriptional regulator GcvA [Alisedimentitalea sp. MJ-SS2]|uniref:transcriptional regulator GcvA n=1 Tax=Aliisedimentitalea sp. MJ-SS2 TaxID=3049795 RepID=UPI002915C237|nr:transcriptional regulator GcvA [Alisedimentitalea sp. MJ-SS2]MDU8928745.1 transcriptional regulator GcvA [Alisedimentitalea sp. MJ-SS2]